MRFRFALLVTGCGFVASSASIDAQPSVAPDEVARWSFEGGDSVAMPAALAGAAQTPLRVGGATSESGSDVPGPYTYDPLSRTSRRNMASSVFDGDERRSDALATVVDFAAASLADGSITIEGFVKPGERQGGDRWLFGKSRAGAGGDELAAQWVRLENANQTWHGAAVRVGQERPNRFPVGRYSSSTRLTGEHRNWRHLALVYDAAALTVTCWVDYHLSRQVHLERPLIWDDGPFLIGGRAADWGAAALIDEVRIVRGALAPEQFQRARADEIANVSFASNQQLMPTDAGCLDVKVHFGAAGDGTTDDTAAFNEAFEHLANKVPLAYNTLLIPPGTYRITGMLYCSRFIDVRGAGPEQTILRLDDGTFTNPADPQPVLRMSSTRGALGSHKGVNGSSISIYLEGLTIDTGRNNPGAKALEYHSNNVGRLENVVLRSGDGGGVLGLDLGHHDVGPALVKHVTIDGFDVGAAIRYQEYSMTFEHLTLRNQRQLGIRNQGNILAIRGLKSENRVTAIHAEGANSMVTLLDSTLSGGDPQQPAIRSDGALYCLRVQTAGYGHAITKRTLVNQKPVEWGESTVAGPNLDEYIGEQPITGFGGVTGALKLPIAETPTPAVPPVGEWVNAAMYRQPEHGEDWSLAVQAAIDAGAPVVYIPADAQAAFLSPIRLHAPLQRIVGLGHGWNWHPSVWKDVDQREQTDAAHAPPPLLIYDEPNPEHVLVLDRLSCVHLRHDSPATLVLRSSSPGRYSTGRAGGRLFAEDLGGADWHFDHPQQVWVRQWNPESHRAGPCIHSQGATIWTLGFKTEYESQKLLAEQGARTEILGAFIHPLGKIPADRPIFENRDSALSVIYGASVYQANHKVHIRDVQGTALREVCNDALKWAGSRSRVDLYTTRP